MLSDCEIPPGYPAEHRTDHRVGERVGKTMSTAPEHPDATALGTVYELSLADRDLDRLPENVGDLRHLKRLDLSRNRLAELPEWLGALAALEELVLRDNRLVELPASLAGLSRLVLLDAAENRLLEVAPEIATMPRLEQLELRGNPHLLTPPPEIVDQGPHAALAYLRELSVAAEADPAGAKASRADRRRRRAMVNADCRSACLLLTSSQAPYAAGRG